MKLAYRICLSLAFLYSINVLLCPTASNAQTVQKSDAPPTNSDKSMPPMAMPSDSKLKKKDVPPDTKGKVAAIPPDGAFRKGWPSPVSDSENYSYTLIDLLEHRFNNNGSNTLRWDVEGWRGGDYNRFWFKSEGRTTLSTSGNGYGEIQALYGRLIAPYTDFQVGLRYDQYWGRQRGKGRAFLAVGVQSLVPFRFDIEPVLYISQNGDLSARFTGTYDTYITQRLILQPRIETKISLQKRESFGEGTGFNDIELGLRLRYEIRREFAPYIGINWEQSLGQTANFARRAGDPTSQLSLVAGIRGWF